MYIILGYVNSDAPPEVVQGQNVYAYYQGALDALLEYVRDNTTQGYFSFYRIGRVKLYP